MDEEAKVEVRVEEEKEVEEVASVEEAASAEVVALVEEVAMVEGVASKKRAYIKYALIDNLNVIFDSVIYLFPVLLQP